MTIEEMKEYKKERGYSLKQIADLSGVPLGTVQKVFSGQTRAPRYATLQALEKVLSPMRKDNQKGNFVSEERTPYMLREHGAYNAANKSFLSGRIQYSMAEDGTLTGPYTCEDYRKLPEDQRMELIHGVFYDMASPSYLHQLIQSNLMVQFALELQRNNLDCDVVGPVDIRLEQDDKTIVQPDISVLCHPDKSRIRDGMIWGAPDLVVEILSPSTRSKDMNLKLKLYEHAGVREYWMIDPRDRVLFQVVFQAQKMLSVHRFQEKVTVLISGGRIRIDLTPIAALINR